MLLKGQFKEKQERKGKNKNDRKGKEKGKSGFRIFLQSGVGQILKDTKDRKKE